MSTPISRRSFLRTLGAGSALGLAGLSGRAAAHHPKEKPSHVTLEYDKQWLKRYRPMLVLRELEVRPLGLHAWLASSPEYETDVGVYWAEYTHQDGTADFDSHDGDHEPCYVFVDSDTGEVRRVVYSAYHWLAAKTSTPPMYKFHPTLHVVSPWHFYFITEELGELVQLKSLVDSFQAWLDNGLEESIAPGTVVNPWVMLSRTDWWQDDIRNFSADAMLMGLAHRVGLYDADRTDLNR